MQKYRLWEANRKVFLYPENWIKPELRDDKSPFFKELESELLQKELNTQTIEDALKNYLFKVDEVANLKMVGLFQELVKNEAGTETPYKLHVFGRTRGAPPAFYYRYFDVLKSNWYPWERLQVDIPILDSHNADQQIMNHGTYLIPVVWDKRLLVFFPQIVSRSKPVDPPPDYFWEIKMAWSERRNEKWTSKQITAEALYVGQERKAALEDFRFVPREFFDGDPLGVISVYVQTILIDGGFWFSGSQLLKKSDIRGGNLKTTVTTEFEYQKGLLHSWQAVGIDEPSIAGELSSPVLTDQPTTLIEGTRPAFLLRKCSSGCVRHGFHRYLQPESL